MPPLVVPACIRWHDALVVAVVRGSTVGPRVQGLLLHAVRKGIRTTAESTSRSAALVPAAATAAPSCACCNCTPTAVVNLVVAACAGCLLLLSKFTVGSCVLGFTAACSALRNQKSCWVHFSVNCCCICCSRLCVLLLHTNCSGGCMCLCMCPAAAVKLLLLHVLGAYCCCEDSLLLLILLPAG